VQAETKRNRDCSRSVRRATIALIGAATVAFLGAATAPASHVPAKVRVVECRGGEGSAGGSAAFRARMSAVEGTRRMSLRFGLVERLYGERRSRRVDVHGLGNWHRSEKGVASFSYLQRVKGLRPGASYRAVVDFRWTGRGGSRILSEQRRSGVCRQPGGPPNLRVRKIAVEPAAAGLTATYAVTVANIGGSAARGFGVELTVGRDWHTDREDVDSLAAGSSRTISFTGPWCAGRRISAMADPDGTVAETNEGDNRREVACPASEQGTPRRR
jgi:hypothetical protein